MIIVVPLKFTPPFFFFFSYTLDLSKYVLFPSHIYPKTEYQSFYILQKVTGYHFCTRLLYHITLASCKCISCFSTFFRHFMELLLLPSGKDLHSNCFIFLHPNRYSVNQKFICSCLPACLHSLLLYVFCLLERV